MNIVLTRYKAFSAADHQQRKAWRALRSNFQQLASTVLLCTWPEALNFFLTRFKAFKQLIISSAKLDMKSCSAAVFNSLQACRTARQQSRHCAAPGTNATPFIHKLNSLLSSLVASCTSLCNVFVLRYCIDMLSIAALLQLLGNC
jgi:hypothetical protein